MSKSKRASRGVDLVRVKAALPLLAALGVTGQDGSEIAGKTLRRWCLGADCPHERPGKGRTSPMFVNPEAVAAWWKARGLAATKGRPAEVDRLLAGQGGAPATSGNGTSSRATSTPEPLKLDKAEREAVEAWGLDPGAIEACRPLLTRTIAAQAKARKDTADARKKELDLQVAAGELHKVEGCVRHQVENVHTVKNRMRAAPGRIAQELAKLGLAPDLIATVRKAVADEFHAVQLEFAGLVTKGV